MRVLDTLSVVLDLDETLVQVHPMPGLPRRAVPPPSPVRQVCVRPHAVAFLSMLKRMGLQLYVLTAGTQEYADGIAAMFNSGGRVIDRAVSCRDPRNNAIVLQKHFSQVLGPGPHDDAVAVDNSPQAWHPDCRPQVLPIAEFGPENPRSMSRDTALMDMLHTLRQLFRQHDADGLTLKELLLARRASAGRDSSGGKTNNFRASPSATVRTLSPRAKRPLDGLMLSGPPQAIDLLAPTSLAATAPSRLGSPGGLSSIGSIGTSSQMRPGSATARPRSSSVPRRPVTAPSPAIKLTTTTALPGGITNKPGATQQQQPQPQPQPQPQSQSQQQPPPLTKDKLAPTVTKPVQRVVVTATAPASAMATTGTPGTASKRCSPPRTSWGLIY